LFEGAMAGMVDQLDENSDYISPANMKKFHEDLDLQIVGIGIQIGLDPTTKQLMVLMPLMNSPAFKAGIRAGDKILRIGDASTQGMSLDDATEQLHGEPGEPVTLSILHEDEEKPVEIKVVREEIQCESVWGDLHNADGTWNFFLEGHDRIGYVRISAFTDETVFELTEALDWLRSQGMRGLVLDLRDNPGGYLKAGIRVCDLFIESGVIVTQHREGRVTKTYSATGDAPFADLPMVVLVDHKSASAAEIVAACLQDHHRAAIVGQRSYGKGTVQEIIELERGCGALKLTISNYRRPSGKNIQRPRKATDKGEWGVSPDEGCKVALNEEEYSRWQLWRARRNLYQPGGNGSKNHAMDKGDPSYVDRQLQRAVERLDKEMNGKK
jgi:carboxyl-terminal processing protease